MVAGPSNGGDSRTTVLGTESGEQLPSASGVSTPSSERENSAQSECVLLWSLKLVFDPSSATGTGTEARDPLEYPE